MFDVQKTTLLLGRKDCNYSQALLDVLQSQGFHITHYFFGGREDVFPRELLAWRGDYVFSFRCPVKIPEVPLKNTNLAAINIHPATPDYCGSGGINWALYDGAEQFGVTIHLINTQIYAGPIIERQRMPVETSDDIASLWPKINHMAFEMASNRIKNIALFGMPFIEQCMQKNHHEKWTGKLRKMHEIDQLENISLDCSIEEFNRIKKATSFAGFGPYIILHGHKFRLVDDCGCLDD